MSRSVSGRAIAPARLAAGLGLAGLPLVLVVVTPRPASGTYENARAVGKRCSTCHTTTHPGVANLNEVGKYYLVKRTLDGAPTPGKAQTPPAPAARPAPASTGAGTGRSVYDRSCALCHGAKGEGTPLARRIDRERTMANDEAAVAKIVRDGTPGGKMPGLAGALTDTEIAAVAKFVMTLGNEARD